MATSSETSPSVRQEKRAPTDQSSLRMRSTPRTNSSSYVADRSREVLEIGGSWEPFPNTRHATVPAGPIAPLGHALAPRSSTMLELRFVRSSPSTMAPVEGSNETRSKYSRTKRSAPRKLRLDAGGMK